MKIINIVINMVDDGGAALTWPNFEYGKSHSDIRAKIARFSFINLINQPPETGFFTNFWNFSCLLASFLGD